MGRGLSEEDISNGKGRRVDVIRKCSFLLYIIIQQLGTVMMLYIHTCFIVY